METHKPYRYRIEVNIFQKLACQLLSGDVGLLGNTSNEYTGDCDGNAKVRPPNIYSGLHSQRAWSCT